MTARPLADELLLGSGGLIWAEFEQAWGHRAVTGLILTLDAEITSADKLGKAFVDLRATVTVDQDNARGLRLGTAFARAPLHFPPSGTEYRRQRLSLEMRLDPVTLATVELARQGRDLRLRVELAGTAVTDTGIGLAGQHSGEHWTIPGEQWVTRVLGQAETYRHITVLAPAPDGDSSEQYRLADKQLEAATTALHQGRFGEAVMAVRKGVDVLGVRSNAAPGTKPHERTVDERFGGIAGALFDMTSAFAHLEGNNATYEWTRPDAVSAIAGLIALMQRSASRA